MCQYRIRKDIQCPSERQINTSLCPTTTQFSFSVLKRFCIELKQNVTRRQCDRIKNIRIECNDQHPSVIRICLQLIDNISNLVSSADTESSPLFSIDITQITECVINNQFIIKAVSKNFFILTYYFNCHSFFYIIKEHLLCVHGVNSEIQNFFSRL